MFTFSPSLSWCPVAAESKPMRTFHSASLRQGISSGLTVMPAVPFTRGHGHGAAADVRSMAYYAGLAPESKGFLEEKVFFLAQAQGHSPCGFSITGLM
jgi:hypothetical protein